ncbi:4773_t:CDS:1, partial [Funneliformis geosporum]
SDMSECLYKTHDDSVRSRHILSTDNTNKIEVILSDRKSHSLHKIINWNEPIQPIIDFDLSVETLNAISPKLSGKQSKNLLCYAFKDTCL